jgi:hypothetical protein
VRITKRADAELDRLQHLLRRVVDNCYDPVAGRIYSGDKKASGGRVVPHLI